MKTPHDGGIYVQHLIDARAQEMPKATAVADVQHRLSYKELNERANQLARHFSSLGIGPDVIVGVLMEKSIDLVVGLLGILKAGGAYLPLDVENSQKRLDLILSDAGVGALLCQESLRGKISVEPLPIVCLERDRELIEQYSTDNLPVEVAGDNLAYVIYTSGTTGKPKGVGIRHCSLANLISWQRQICALTSTDRTSLIAGSAFDASILELWPYLASGASIHIPDAQTRQLLPSLLSWIGRERISVCFLPTPLAELAIQEPWPADRSLRILLTGGEKLHGRPGTDMPFVLMNLYGPTENTVVSTSAAVAPADRESGSPHIGRALTYVESYALDANLSPVEPGTTGELYVGGGGLARGYLNHSDLTAEQFIPNPFSDHPGERIYRTGDQVYLREDGNIEFIGRTDRQIKVRGFRIELGEIDEAVRRQPGVREAVAEYQTGGGKEKRLVGYVVWKPGFEPPTRKSFREGLKEILPEYMIPTAWIWLPELPLTENGKINRAILPPPGLEHLTSEEEYVPAQGAIEELIAGLWVEILNLHHVGIHDNFFELGGDSLSLIRMMVQLRRIFAVEIPIHQLFNALTIADLASLLEQLQHKGTPILKPPIKLADRNRPLPLSFAQQRLWLINQLDPNSPLYNIPAAMRLKGNLSVQTLERSLGELIRRHETLRTVFIEVDGQPKQVIHPPEAVRLPVIDLSDLNQECRQKATIYLAALESAEPFNLSRGPLVRFRLIKQSEDEQALLLTVHHIVTDGWSNRLLITEIITLYNSFSQGMPSPLPELPIQYADFAVWQREWLLGGVLEEELRYWSEQLNGAPVLLELPTDRPRLAFPRFWGRSQKIRVSKNTTDNLRLLGNRSGATLFMTLLAVFNALLYRQAGLDDIPIGTPIAGRQYPEVDHLIGFFVNTIVLRNRLTEKVTFRDFLGSVRQVMLEAFAHAEMPFEMLVEKLKPTRSTSYSPLFQVMFAFDSYVGASAPIPEGLTVSALTDEITSHEVMVKYELTLTMAELDGEIGGTLSYDAHLFDEVTMSRMAATLQTLLESIAASPDVLVEQLSLLSESQRQQLLFEWNQRSASLPQPDHFASLFSLQVEKAPDASAIIGQDGSISYQELHGRAHQLGQRLRQLGVCAESRIVVLLESAIEMAVALVAIYRAGGAIVPLPPDCSPNHVRKVLDDSGAKVLITPKRRFGEFSENPQYCVAADGDWEKIVRQPNENPVQEVTPGQLGAVFYPQEEGEAFEGLMVTYDSIIGQSISAQAKYQIPAEGRILYIGSLASEAVIRTIFASLMQGATISIRDAAGDWAADFLSARDEVAPQQLRLSAACWHQLVIFLFKKPNLKFPENIQSVIIEGGKPLKRQLALWRWHLASKQTDGDEPFTPRLIRAHLPVGTGLLASVWEEEPHWIAQLSRPVIPAGRAAPHVEVYILDERLEPVPTGIVGQMYLGGSLIARGYQNDSLTTAARFIPHPFSAVPGARIFRTGDLARYLPDGSIEFIGRENERFNLNGFAINLSEIEAGLLEHPAIRQASVGWREGKSHNSQLVAYLETDLSELKLKEYIRYRFPHHLAPQDTVIVNSMPLTSAGAIDRRRLAEASHLHEASETAPSSLLAASASARTASANRIAERRADLAERRAKLSKSQMELLNKRLKDYKGR